MATWRSQIQLTNPFNFAILALRFVRSLSAQFLSRSVEVAPIVSLASAACGFCLLLAHGRHRLFSG